mmetsp:Transcript_59173/g.139374  ORF Transcript_59173/g.139374 Transcript_59173/m.139374 type:complete len:183 (-) Transcript_59173:36-584(-)|eukprot:CAMPEP_0177729684 /NCGR_PEP_ID=MMETSP0484_2-20121128/21571_1 /TAXON_ID=354590 /ORGANISM="Rhodomonas lens, Strain RHODO" /LENGTH=182 /DNA_ID=CAMNT_0019242591 /DNA_START=115 /DNA_END=663 /DNA_ORIENTATION=-
MTQSNLAENCCGCFSLTQGVYIVAGMDFLQGVLTVFLGLCVLTAPDSFQGHPLAHHFLYNETTVLAVLVMSTIGGVSAYFALCAIRGVRNVDPRLLWYFFLWKAGRAFFFSLLLLSDVWKTLGTEFQGSYMMIFATSTAWRAYLLWVVFSLYEKINTNDASGAAMAGYSRSDIEEHMPIVVQ